MISFRKRDEQPTPTKADDTPGATGPDGAARVPGSDDGLSMPPFRPAAPGSARNSPESTEQEMSMARSPFAPTQPTPAQPTPPASPLSGATFRPTVGPRAENAERRTLVVGRGISVQGVVQDAERLVVEGTVEATMIKATELAITQGGVFKGEVEVEEAEIAGTIDGTLTARHALIVRATGRVLGTARCRRLQVEDGGQITGRIEMITEGAAASE
jgi:Integral membrane protein CcmA involved in cell shape determination